MTTPTTSTRRSQPHRQTRTAVPPRRTAPTHAHAPPQFYPALTAFTDALDRLPSETIRHLTLLREVDAKAYLPESQLRTAIQGNNLPAVRGYLQDLLLTQDEKIHVVTTANEALSRVLRSVEHAFAYVEVEIPELYRLGSREHWAYRAEGETATAKEPERKKRKVVERERERERAVEKELTPVPAVVAAAAAKEKRRAEVKKRRPAPTPNHSALNSPLLPPPASPVVTPVVVTAPPPPQQEVVESPKKEQPTAPPKKKKTAGGEEEQTYCYCDGISYGEMVACDSEDCVREWFHLECVGLDVAPRGKVKWFCEECKVKRRAGGAR